MRSYTRSEDTMTAYMARQLWDYDPEIGVLIWRISMKGIAAGKVAGKVNPTGNRVVVFEGRTYQATRLAWLHYYGEQPKGHVVPENGDRSDLRIENLKDQPQSDTVQASKLRTTNRSGHRGVSWNNRQQKWVASVSRNHRRVHLGFHDTVEAAAAAVAAALKDGLPTNKGSILPKRPGEEPRRRWIARRTAMASPHLIGFPSAEVLAAELGAQPSPDHVISRIKLIEPLGPGNVEWRLPWTKGGEKRAYHHANIGLSDAQVSELRASQGDVCAICDRPERRKGKSGETHKLALDHEHDTNAARGIICNDCNRAIGLLGEDYERVIKVAEYMRFGRFSVSEKLGLCASCQNELPEDTSHCHLAIDGDGDWLGPVCEDCDPRDLYRSRPAMKLGDSTVNMGSEDWKANGRRVRGAA